MTLRLGLLLVLEVAGLFTAGTCSQQMEGSKRVSQLNLHRTRSSPLDLEIAGQLLGLASGTVRYLTRDDLLSLPLASYTVTDDENFGVPIQIRGVDLEVLQREFAAQGEKALVVAVCSDLYRGLYPHTYIQVHRPLLVLEINGQAPSGWPKRKDLSGLVMGPYLISHPHFTPSFKILSHEEEAQIPWGVVRLEFWNEEAVFASIAPQGANVSNPTVQAGYRIAQQNCFRCHASTNNGPLKGILTWSGIALFASTAAPRDFAAYVRNPQNIAQNAQMPGNPNYDDATIQALISYFRAFLAKEKP